MVIWFNLFSFFLICFYLTALHNKLAYKNSTRPFFELIYISNPSVMILKLKL